MEELKLLESGGLRDSIAKKVTNYGGILVSVFLMFAVIIITTTDVRITSLKEAANLGRDFFLLLFATWGTYVSCSDTGTRAGLLNTVYLDTLHKFEGLKDDLIISGKYARLPEYCAAAIEEELKAARSACLVAVGISYETYVEKYLALDKKAIKACNELSAPQKIAIRRANRLKPMHLTPDMILRQGKNTRRSLPLGVHPQTAQRFGFVKKLFTMAIVTICVSIVALDVSANPSWAVVAKVFLKLASVVYNGFSGYCNGYKYIVTDTTDYMREQIKFMHQGAQYINAHPENSEIK